ncbi:PhzF family phenazine biosynthesis isomerase, partial [candidate division GN15 bacterium]|nr:PhzF family phenazine biosynthesis isomerase [candidate division GN15 bacterium]
MAQTIIQVDAFTDRPFGGNPAAVCVLDRERDEAWMQAVALEMNLSETAFPVRSGDDWQLRWFTPAVEVELCGHATLGTAHVLFSDGLAPAGSTITFHTKSGRLRARQDGEYIV